MASVFGDVWRGAFDNVWGSDLFSIATEEGVEWTLPVNRMHYTLPVSVAHFTLPTNRPHFELPGEN